MAGPFPNNTDYQNLDMPISAGCNQYVKGTEGTYLEDLARAQHLGGDQWGMMNETGNYPGQAWLWLYTFWYQVKPFSTSGNADALVWSLMALFTLAFVLVPYIPGVRSIPKLVPIYRLIWRNYYRDVEGGAG